MTGTDKRRSLPARRVAKPSEIRTRAETLIKYMGYTLRKGTPGKKAKPLIPELMKAFGVSRQTVNRALKTLPRRPKAANTAAVAGYGDQLAKAHAQAKGGPMTVVRDVDADLQRALLAWLTQSLRKRADSTELAKALLQTLREMH